MKTIIKYDLQYLVKTKKHIVFLGVALFIAITSVLTAKYINEILAFAVVDGFTLPEPTVVDSYIQYIGNLADIFLLLSMFVSLSMFIRDKTKGLYALILSKPINRTTYLLSKYISLNLLIMLTIVISNLIFAYYTYFVFGEVDLVLVFLSTLMYFIYILFITGLTLLFSTIFKSYLGAIAATFGVYIILGIITMFNRGFFEYQPGNTMGVISTYVMTNEIPSSGITTIIVTFIFSIIFVILGVMKFQKNEL